MAKSSWFQRMFNLRKGEGKQLVELVAFSFFIGAATAFFYTSSTSLFLLEFERGAIPLAYVIGGLFLFGLGKGVSKVQQKLPFSVFSVAGVVFLAASILLMVLGYMATGNKWLAFLMFVWMRVIVFVQALTFWGVAGKVFDLRQGKRLFGLIGTGEVLASMLSFFSVPILLRYISTEQVMLISFGAMAVCIVLMMAIVARFRERLSQKPAPKGAALGEDGKPVGKSMRELFREPYFRTFFWVSLLPMFGNFFVDFIFMVNLKDQFSEAQVLSVFIALFFGFNTFVEFLMKTFLSGKLLSRYGLRFGLASLPFISGLSVALAIFSGFFFGTAIVFLGFVSMTKLFFRVLRTSFYDPAFQVLFQPLPKEDRVAMQNFMESGPKAFGGVAAGVLLLLLGFLPGMSLIHFNVILLAMLLFWVPQSLKMAKEYKMRLQANLETIKQNKSLKNEEELSNTNLAALRLRLAEAEPEEFAHLLLLVERLEPAHMGDILTELLGLRPDLRGRLLALVRERLVLSAIPTLRGLASREDGSEAGALCEFLEEKSRRRMKDLARMCGEADWALRLEAARLLGYTGRFKAIRLLLSLMQDDNGQVREQALVSAGKIRRKELNAFVVNSLSSIETATLAASAIRKIGPPILPGLDNYFQKKMDEPHRQFRVVKAMETIIEEDKLELLANKLTNSSLKVKANVLRALHLFGYKVSEKNANFFKGLVEKQVEHHVWLLATSIDLDPVSHPRLVDALEIERRSSQEKIFQLLGCLYDNQTMATLQESLSSEGEDRNYALEILEMVLTEDLKALVVPMVENTEMPLAVKAYENLFPQRRHPVQARLKELLMRDFSTLRVWTKACAVLELEKQADPEAQSLLRGLALHPNMLLREVSCQVLLSRWPGSLEGLLADVELKYPPEALFLRKFLNYSKDPQRVGIWLRIELLRQNRFFSSLHQSLLVGLAFSCKPIRLSAGQEFRLDPDKDFLLVCEGRLSLSVPEVPSRWAASELLGELTAPALRRQQVELRAVEDCLLMAIPTVSLYDLLNSNVEVTKSFLAMLSRPELSVAASY